MTLGCFEAYSVFVIISNYLLASSDTTITRDEEKREGIYQIAGKWVCYFF